MIERIIFSLRLLPTMHADLIAWAKEENRSVHNLIEWIIKQALTAHKTEEQQ